MTAPRRREPRLAGHREIRVLQPFRMIRPTTNPYIVMLDRALRETPGIRVATFSYRRAFLGGYDVVHLHWPETLLEGRTTPRRLARLLLAHLYLLRLRLGRVAVVRTVHNLDLPSGLWPAQIAYLRGLERLTAVRVHLNEQTGAAGEDVEMVPHGHYRDWFAGMPTSTATPGRIGFVGLVRGYKNVTGLVAAFREATGNRVADDGELSLQVCGKASNTDLERDLRRAVGDMENVDLDLRFLTEEELAIAVTGCELLVLPYRHMHNSGVALTALSLNRPVLVPRNPTTLALQREVGDRWVHTFTGEIDGADLLAALRTVRAAPGGAPDLSARNWDLAGRAHRRAYLRALRSRHRRVRRGRTAA
ncbi:glycosyl transferase [Serinibacter salmoneus]|uniref:Glycosyltransferase involved in cell wall biosynthesis n=1 Tax=Serinibacter salmoneus TaxID=556530 RepID=A0A2A9D1B0_9MICO|nr:glycosyl transferase [Serinibacter salmoneus]PFG20467.1 glycosyltransferase involved in cell wall biosynthesis [Serinibacter salmoneus]